jgi:outer membrane lipoprotein-sorting protein
MAMSGLRTWPVRSPRHALGSIVGVVSELGEVLELLHDAAGRVTTLSATLREWWDEQQSRRAMEAAVRNAQGASHTWLVGDGEPSPPPRYREHRTSIHYQRPGRYRSERQPVAASQEPAILQVCDGTREWTYVPDRAEAWVQQAGAYQMADDLLDPAWLPGEFLLGVAGRLHRERRAAIQLHGRLRAGQDRGVGGSRAPPGAEEIRAIIDADTGLLLELTSLFEGEPLSRRSLNDVVLNEPLDEALFRFTPPPDTRVEDVQARQHRPPFNLRWRLRFWRPRPRPVATYGRFRRLP